MQTGAHLGQLARGKVDPLLLGIRAIANRVELACHVPNGLGQVGKLPRDERGVLSLRSHSPGFYARGVALDTYSHTERCYVLRDPMNQGI